MDIDQFLARNAPSWARLQQLTERAGTGTGRLSSAELQELIALYQRTASHLSYAQTNFHDQALNARLSQQVAAAGAIVYGTRPKTLRAAGLFFTRTFPAALWRARAFVVVSLVLSFAPAIAVGVWLANSPAALEATAPAAVRQAYVNRDFASYYNSQPAADFASEVYFNNAKVAILAFGGGITGGLLTVYVLVTNGVNLGQAAGLFAAAGQTPKFYGLVLPHGLMELTSVVIAGAAGLQLGWALVDPGDRPRSTAFAEEGQRTVVLILGTILTLLVAGLIEGFVTGSSLSTGVRVGIGVAVELAFLTYVAVLGPAATAAGYSGALIGDGRAGELASKVSAAEAADAIATTRLPTG